MSKKENKAKKGEKSIESSKTSVSMESSESPESRAKKARCVLCGAEISTLEKGVSKLINAKSFGINSKNGCVMTPLDLAKNAGRICLACTIKGKARRK